MDGLHKQRMDRGIAAWAHDRERVASEVAPRLSPNALRTRLHRWRNQLAKRVGASRAECIRLRLLEACPDDPPEEIARFAKGTEERFAADYQKLLTRALHPSSSA